MSKKLILVFLCVVFFSRYHLARADVVINEIMYSPASKQWVEVYNNSDTDIDITQYKILDAGASKDGHNISPATTNGSNIIPAHSYGVIAKDITSVSTSYLFHASLGISTTANDVVILKNNNNVIDSVSISPDSATDGNSLQLINGSWVSAPPTPGLDNNAGVSVSSDNSQTIDDNGGSTVATIDNPSSGGVTTTNSKTVAEQKIKTQITSKVLGLVNVPLPFQATVFGHKGEKLYSGEYFWNFGDGGSGKMDAFNTQPFSHTYYYPGNYVVSLDYYQTFYTDDSTPDASSQVNIKIIPESISISNVGDANDFFIEITNNTNDSADLSNWVLVSAQKGFKIPRNTIVASKQKIILSPKITNFSIEDENTLKLLDSQGNLIFDYSSPPVNQPDQISLSGTKPIKTTRTKNQDFTQQEIPTNNLTASAVSSDVANNNSTSNFATIIFIIFLIFIGVMAYAVYFVRHKKMIPDETGSDFEILDE